MFINSRTHQTKVEEPAGGLAAQFPKEELQLIREAFNSYDKSRSGTITRDEFAALVEEIDPSFPKAMLKQGFSMLDANGNNQIEWSEFIEWWVKEDVKMSRQMRDLRTSLSERRGIFFGFSCVVWPCRTAHAPPRRTRPSAASGTRTGDEGASCGPTRRGSGPRRR